MDGSKARVVGGVLALLVLGGIGTAWAVSTDRSPWTAGENPASAQDIGVPRLGDEVRYDWTRDTGDRTVEGSLVFTWNTTETRETRVGVDRRLALVEGGFVWDPDDDEGTPFELAYFNRSSDPSTVTLAYRGSFGIPLGVAQTSWEFEFGQRSFVGFGDQVALCLVRADWQSQPVDEIGNRSLREHCPGLAPPAGDEAGGELTRIGTEERHNRTAVGYEAEPRFGDDRVRVRAWFLPELPYPVNLTVEGPDRSDRFVLDGFEPGNRTLEEAPVEARPSLEDHRSVDLAEPGRWGIVEGDPETYPYPPGEAIQQLQEDPTLPQFHAYLDENPDARVVAYTYDEDDEGPGPSQAPAKRWCFLFNDPDGDGYRACATRTEEAGAGDRQQPLPQQTERTNASEADLPPLDPEQLPARTAAVSDVVETWRDRDPEAGRLTTVHAVLQPSLEDPAGQLFVPGRDVLVGHGNASGALETDGAGAVTRSSAGNFTGYTAELGTGSSVAEFSARLARTTTIGATGTSAGMAPPSVDAGGAGDADLLLPWATGLGLLAALAYLLADPIARLVVAPLHHRIKGAEVLEHDTRARLYETIQAEPGLHEAELARGLDASEGTVGYHLSVLERAGYLTSLELGGCRRFFEQGALTEEEKRRIAVLRAGSHEELYELVREEPGLNQRALAAKLGVSDPAVHKSLVKLEEVDLVERDREGASVRVYPGVSVANGRN